MHAMSVRISSSVRLSMDCKSAFEHAFFVKRNGISKPSISLNKIDFPSEIAAKLISVGTDI